MATDKDKSKYFRKRVFQQTHSHKSQKVCPGIESRPAAPAGTVVPTVTQWSAASCILIPQVYLPVSRVHHRRDIYYSHVRYCYSYTFLDGRKRQCLSVTRCWLQTHLQQSLMYAHVHITTFHGSIFSKKDVRQVVTVSSIQKCHRQRRSSRTPNWYQL